MLVEENHKPRLRDTSRVVLGHGEDFYPHTDERTTFYPTGSTRTPPESHLPHTGGWVDERA